MKINKLLRRLFVVYVLLLSNPSFAQGERISLFESDGYINISGGESFSQAIGLGFGVSAGYRALQKFHSITLGLSYSNNPISTTFGPNVPVISGQIDRLIYYTFTVMHNFSDENQGFVLGLKTGYGTRHFSNGLVIAPVVQYHYPLFDFLTVGLQAEATGFWVSGFTPRSVALLTQAVIQYWF